MYFSPSSPIFNLFFLFHTTASLTPHILFPIRNTIRTTETAPPEQSEPLARSTAPPVDSRVSFPLFGPHPGPDSTSQARIWPPAWPPDLSLHQDRCVSGHPGLPLLILLFSHILAQSRILFSPAQNFLTYLTCSTNCFFFIQSLTFWDFFNPASISAPFCSPQPHQRLERSLSGVIRIIMSVQGVLKWSVCLNAPSVFGRWIFIVKRHPGFFCQPFPPKLFPADVKIPPS